METVTTTDTAGSLFKVAIGIDMKSAAILGVTVFIALVGALIIYKNL